MTRMAQEEETQKCSNSNSGGDGVGVSNIGRFSKKQKQKPKKVPQRGLGVAQLEKIRLEEQQKKNGSIITLPSQSPMSPMTRPPNLSVSIPSYSTYSNLSSPPNSLLRPQNLDPGNTNTVPLPHSSLGWQSCYVQGHGNVPEIWSSCDHNIDKDSCEVDVGLAFQSGVNLPYESNKPIWPLPSLMQRAHQFQQPPPPPPPPPLMVNVSSTSSSSSLLNFPIEPPSNQSCYGNSKPVWPEEDKMVGMKRTYPFSLENQPAPSFHYNKFPQVLHPISRSDESASSFGNGGAFNFSPGNHPSFREGPSCLTSKMELNSKKITKENGALSNGDFLTLAPPTILTCPTSKFKSSSSTFLAFDFDSLPYQGNMEVPNQQHRPYYSFLPTSAMQTGQATKTRSINCNGGHEVGETVDLNLKL